MLQNAIRRIYYLGSLATMFWLVLPMIPAASADMETLVREAFDQTNPLKNPFDNKRRVQRFERMLERGGPFPQDMDEQTARMRYVHELLRSGETKKALRELNELEAGLEGNVPNYLKHLKVVAYLRLAEQSNCILLHDKGSCIVPIAPNGQHLDRFGSLSCKELLLQQVGLRKENLVYNWLLNLVAMTLGEFPDGVPEAYRLADGVLDDGYFEKPFVDAAPRTGLDYFGISGGAILEDFDEDGVLEVVTSTRGRDGGVQYFNLNDQGRYENASVSAGFESAGGGLNMMQADYDNDGLTDIYVFRGAWGLHHGFIPDSLYRNLGGNRFEDVTLAAGLWSPFPSQAGAWWDFNHDGWLDLLIGNETFDEQKVHPVQLYISNGDGTFTENAAAWGMVAQGVIKGIAVGDYNGDGFGDVYISRFHQRNSLFVNYETDDGKRAFKEVTDALGVGGPSGSFTPWFWDYNQDGAEDLFVSGFGTSYGDFGKKKASPRKYAVANLFGQSVDVGWSALYRNDGNGQLVDMAGTSGMNQFLLAMGANCGDLDANGYRDVYFGTGALNLALVIPNRLFMNVDGSQFMEATYSAGVGHIQKGHAVSFGDLDNDGALDLFSQLGGGYSGDAYQNVLFHNPGITNNWVGIRLRGHTSNRSALGAKIRVQVRGGEVEKTFYRTVTTGGSFGSNPLRQYIGLGSFDDITSLSVDWPASGITQSFSGLEPGFFYEGWENSTALLRMTTPHVGFAATPDQDHGSAHKGSHSKGSHSKGSHSKAVED